MIKAKAKADRAAARLAAQSASQSYSAPATAVELTPASVPVADDASPAAATQDAASQDAEDNVESAAALPNVEPPPDRTEILRSKSTVVGRFMRLLVPILVDVYAASVITPVRIKTLTGLLKAISFLDPDGLKKVLLVGSPCFMLIAH